MKRIILFMTLFTVIFAFSTCTIAGPPSVPAGLTASTDLHDKIELTWNADANAGVFHVYRGLTSEIEKADEAYIVSTAQNGFIDTEVETDITYWYAVCAADPFGNNETPLSGSVEGIAPPLVWSAPETVAETVSGVLFAEGGTTPRIVAAASADGSIIPYEYDEEAGWSPGEEAAGTTAEPAFMDAAVIGGDLHVAYIQASPPAAPVIRFYGEEGWETLGHPGTDNLANGPISLAGSGGFLNPDVYIGYLDGTDGITTLYYPNPVNDWDILGTIEGATSPDSVALTVFDGNPYLFYENNDGSPSLDGQVYEDPAGWTALPATGVGDTEYITLTPGTNALYLAGVDSLGNLEVLSYAAGAWETIGSFSGVNTSAGLIDIAILNGVPCLAYLSGSGIVVKSYEEETWTDTPWSEEDPVTGIASLDLEVHGGTLRLLTLAGGTAEVRSFE